MLQRRLALRMLLRVQGKALFVIALQPFNGISLLYIFLLLLPSLILLSFRDIMLLLLFHCILLCLLYFFVLCRVYCISLFWFVLIVFYCIVLCLFVFKCILLCLLYLIVLPYLYIVSNAWQSTAACWIVSSQMVALLPLNRLSGFVRIDEVDYRTISII